MDFDINGFEVIGKVVRRSSETFLDSYCALEEAFCTNFLHGLLVKPGAFSNDQGVEILNAAREALAHKDLKEAEHQLNREIYFCSIFPHENLGIQINEASARDGLKAIHETHDAASVNRAMNDALFNMASDYIPADKPLFTVR